MDVRQIYDEVYQENQKMKEETLQKDINDCRFHNNKFIENLKNTLKRKFNRYVLNNLSFSCFKYFLIYSWNIYLNDETIPDVSLKNLWERMLYDEQFNNVRNELIDGMKILDGEVHIGRVKVSTIVFYPTYPF